MKVFWQRPCVHRFEDARSFAEEFEIGESDFILASRSTYEAFFENLDLKAHVEFKSKYGNGEPDDAMMDAMQADFAKTGCTRIIAIGGGAVIDMAKILVLDGNARAADIFQRKVPLKKVRELIAVPTTCGAGSEVSSVSITEVKEMGTKLGLAADEIFPDHAVLIPQLLEKLPYSFFATSAIDAFIHAIESFVSPKANLYTEMFSMKAIEMIVTGFQAIAEHGPEYRMNLLDEFLTASDLAGIAFGNAGTGAVHAMSYPLSGRYHVTHGEANYQFFTAVFAKYAALNPDGKLKRMNVFLADLLGCRENEVYQKLEVLLDQIIHRKPLREYGMTEDEIVSFADIVAQSQQRLLNQSYVKFTTEQMQEIYRELY